MEIIPAKLDKWIKFKTLHNIEGYAMLFEIKHVKFYIRVFNDNSYGICLISKEGLLSLERIVDYKMGIEYINDKNKLITEMILLIVKNFELIMKTMKMEDFNEKLHDHDIDTIYRELYMK